MNRTELLLNILAEECCEVVQRVSKALRFGLTEQQTGHDLNNVERISQEWDDLRAAYEMLYLEGVVPAGSWDRVEAKMAKVEASLPEHARKQVSKTMPPETPKGDPVRALPPARDSLIARAICTACGERPDAPGDSRGNSFRWEDYLSVVPIFRLVLSQSQNAPQIPKPPSCFEPREAALVTGLPDKPVSLFDHPGTSNYHDNTIWVALPGIPHGQGFWMKPGQSLCVLPTSQVVPIGTIHEGGGNA